MRETHNDAAAELDKLRDTLAPEEYNALVDAVRAEYATEAAEAALPPADDSALPVLRVGDPWDDGTGYGTAAPQMPLSVVARKRGLQTGVQGLLVDLLVAVALVVATVLPGVETWEDVARLWPAWLLLVAKSIVQAAVAYAIRRYGDGEGTPEAHNG